MKRTSAKRRRDPRGFPTATAAKAPRFEKVCDKDDNHVITHDLANVLEWDVACFSGKRMTFEQAKQACAELRTGGHADWRLPTVQELLTLVDYGRSEPAINTEYFPGTQSNYYRASTPYAPYSGCAWGVGFGGGGSGGLTHGNDFFVRAVRASQS